MIECPNCGGNMKFDISTQNLLCAFCETQIDPQEYQDSKDEKGSVLSEDYEVTCFTCPQCGGEVLSTDEAAAGFCSFCGASTILYSRIRNEKRPKYIIPFQKTKEECKEAYLEEIKRAIFAPSKLKDKDYIESFRGIYMPYWDFQLTYDTVVTVEATRTYEERWNMVQQDLLIDGEYKAKFDGIYYDASVSFADDISQTLAPFQKRKQKEFKPAYMSGFYADAATVPMEMYREDAKTLVSQEALNRIKKEMKDRDYSYVSPEFTYMEPNECQAQLTMLPVWFLSYRKGDRVAYITVNGESGKVVADIPIDMKKYIFLSLLLAVPISVLLGVYLLVRPETMLAISTIFALFTMVLSGLQILKILKKKSRFEDKAYLEKYNKKRYQELEKKRERRKKIKKYLSLGLFELQCLSAFLYVLTAGFIYLLCRTWGNINFVWIIIVLEAIMAGVVLFSRIRLTKTPKGIVGVFYSFVAIAFSTTVSFLNLSEPTYHYVAAILSLLAVLVMMFGQVQQLNHLSTRKLPQFNKEGGDHHA